MKICIFTNHFYPEDFKVNDIAFELAKSGYDVTVLTAIPDYPKGKFYEGYSLFKRRREVVNGVNVIRLPLIPRGKGGAIRLILNYLSYYFCLSIFTFFHSFKHKYDRIFVHLTSPFFIGVCAKKMSKRQKIPLFFWVLDLWPESLISAGGISNPLIIKPQIRMVQKVYDQCSKILISSKGFEKSICEKGDYKDKLVYFPNWAEDVKGECPADFDINKIEPFATKKRDDFILLFAGNIGEAQNLDAVLKAADLLKDEKRIKFVFVGDGRRKEALEQFARENELHDTVFFLGRYPITTMPVFMNTADVLMFSLKDELCFNLTVPAKVQFYMSQGKPILAMINGDGAELVEEAKCGMAVNAGDSNSFAEAVKTMADNDLKSFGKNGKKFYEENFTKKQRMIQLKSLLNIRYIWNNSKKEISLLNMKTGVFFALKINMYTILDLIGEGANGVVIKARNNNLDRIEAIKIWLPNRTKNNVNVDVNQYLEEVRKIANLKNNNIVTMFNAWEQDGYYLASTEYIDGKNLKDWLKTPFGIEEIERRKVCQQLLETVLFYQIKGIIHGDIHAGNILIDNNNQIHIIDFGTSYFTRDKNNGRTSIDREINLLYEDIKLILGESFNEKFLLLNFHKNHKLRTDTLNPILFTKTLLKYNEIISIKETARIIIDKDVLVEYCSHVADGFYFNLSSIIGDLKTWSSLSNITTLSTEALKRIIYTHVFIEDGRITPYHTYDILPEEQFYPNEIEAVSAYVYFELSKNNYSEEKYIMTKQSYFEQYRGILDENTFDELWNTLKNFENNSLFEVIKSKSGDFINKPALLSDYLQKIRSILCTLIIVCLKNNYLDFYYLLWIKITEVRLNKELHEKIMKEIASDY